jgi:ATP-dependent Lon protease
MVMALLSLLTKKSASGQLAMTGEVTLRGRVMPVGGVKQKVLAAHRAGLKKVVIPKRNEADLDDLPPEVSEKMEFILAETIDDVFPHVLPGLKKVGNNGRRPRPTKLISTNGHIDEIPVTPEPVEAE